MTCGYSVAQSCPTLCNPTDCSTPGFPVLLHLLEFAQTHVHWVGDTIQPSHPLLSPSPTLKFVLQVAKAWKNTEIKTSIKYHLTLLRMAIIKKSTNNSWKGWGENGTLLHCWWECKLVQSLWKTVWRFLKKLKIELPYDPVIPLLSIYPTKLKFKKIHTPQSS